MATAVVGFLVGSAATYAYTRYFSSSSDQPPQEQQEPNEHDPDHNNNNNRNNSMAAKRSQSRDLPAGTASSSSSSSLSLLPFLATSSLPRSSAVAAATATQSQSGFFVSDILAHVWPYINQAACQTIRDTVEPTFRELLPGPLKTLHFTQLDLGVVPIRLDNMVVHPLQYRNSSSTTTTSGDGDSAGSGAGAAYLQLDLDVLWDGTCDIQLKADYIGSFGVQKVKLAGRLSVLLQPIVPTLSLVQAVQVAFLHPPTIALDFVGLANVADFQLIKTKIQAVLDQVLQSMMVLPQRFVTKLDPTCSLYQMAAPPLGILRVMVRYGHGFVNEKRALRSDDIPDVYVTVTLGNVTHRTWTQHNTLQPDWGSGANKNTNNNGYVMDFMVLDHDQHVLWEVYDEDKGALDGDDYLGCTFVTVGELLLFRSTQTLELLRSQTDSTTTGAKLVVSCQLLTFTTSVWSSITTTAEYQDDTTALLRLPTESLATTTATPDASKNKKDNTKQQQTQQQQQQQQQKDEIKMQSDLVCGLLSILIPQAYDLPVAVQDDKGAAAAVVSSAFVKVTMAMHGNDDDDDDEDGSGGKNSTTTPNTRTSLTNQELFVTKTIQAAPGTNEACNPVFDAAFYLPLTSRHLRKATDNLKDDKNNNDHNDHDKNQYSRKLKDITLHLMNGPDSCLAQRTVTHEMLLTAPNGIWTETYIAPPNPTSTTTVSCSDTNSSSHSSDQSGASASASASGVQAAPKLEYRILVQGLTKPRPTTPTAAAAGSNKLLNTSLASNNNNNNNKDNMAMNSENEAVATTSIDEAPNQEPQVDESISKVRLTVVKGHGFQVEPKRGAFRPRRDVPDIYCQITFGSSPTVWRTSTIRNSTTPLWTIPESRDYIWQNQSQIIHLHVYDEDGGKSRDNDDLLGTARITVGQLLLAGGRMDVELNLEGRPTRSYITLLGSIVEEE
ncbi:hypothetical protein ACA910_005725 [Epithemia clementina (nom. ined.)]